MRELATALLIRRTKPHFCINAAPKPAGRIYSHWSDSSARSSTHNQWRQPVPASECPVPARGSQRVMFAPQPHVISLCLCGWF